MGIKHIPYSLTLRKTMESQMVFCILEGRMTQLSPCHWNIKTQEAKNNIHRQALNAFFPPWPQTYVVFTRMESHTPCMSSLVSASSVWVLFCDYSIPLTLFHWLTCHGWGMRHWVSVPKVCRSYCRWKIKLAVSLCCHQMQFCCKKNGLHFGALVWVETENAHKFWTHSEIASVVHCYLITAQQTSVKTVTVFSGTLLKMTSYTYL